MRWRLAATLGDIVLTYLNTTTEHLKKVLLPLDDIIASTGFDTSVFWPAIMQALSVDGKLYALPNHCDYGTVVYYFNKTLYEVLAPMYPIPTGQR